MCDREEFARVKDMIVELQKADAVQSVQINTLFKTTEQQSADIKAQSDNQLKLVNRLVMAIIGVLFIAMLTLIYGAIGNNGFNAVTKAAPNLIKQSSSGVITK